MDWVRRNRRRLALGGGLLGGLYIVGRVAGRQVALAREEEGRRALVRGKKSQHFAATEATGADTLSSLVPTMRDQVDGALDTTALTALLRERPDAARKVELWDRLKVVALGRCLAVVVGGAHLAVMLRTQLHVLAGQLYQQETTGPPGPADSPRMSAALQQAFLHISHHFVTAGTRELCRRLEEVVTDRAAALPLQRRLTLADLESVIMDVFQGCREQEGGLFTDPGAFFLPGPGAAAEQELSDPERARLRGLLADCLDLLETPDTRAVTVQLCRQGLAHLLDRVADYYAAAGEDGEEDKESSESDSDSGFISPAAVSLPVARLLPILTKQARVDEGESDLWLEHLQASPALRTMAANVYEAFCHPPQAEAEGWGDVLYRTVSSWHWRTV